MLLPHPPVHQNSGTACIARPQLTPRETDAPAGICALTHSNALLAGLRRILMPLQDSGPAGVDREQRAGCRFAQSRGKQAMYITTYATDGTDSGPAPSTDSGPASSRR